MTSIRMTSSRKLRFLLVGCSSLALAMPAAANDVIFTSSGTQIAPGKRTVQTSGVTQIKLASGGFVSITQGAEYTINEDGSIDLFRGSITVTGAARSPVEVRMPGAIAARIVGTSSSSSFSVADDGTVSGHTLTGVVRVSDDGKRRRPYREGQMWSADAGESPSRTMANGALEQPSAAPTQVAAIGGDAGPANAALNGIPVTLGDGLAAAGASSDIINAGRRVEAAVANPSIDRFPVGDLALLVAAAADLERAYGGTPFNSAQADIIRTYLGFLSSGATGAEFLTAYSNFTLGYLELIRAGSVPSGFANGVASAADIDAYLAFITRNGAIANLGVQDRALADAYLAFIASGQNRDLFAASFTDLTAAYFAFLRSGGAPSEFTGASQEALAQSIAFLQQSGLLVQLSAADQALVTAFLNNGGIDFAAQFQSALTDYFAFLASGQRPSDYAQLDQAVLRSYLETLSNTGLLANLQADQAQFFADYLAFLRGGGDVDAFAGLPANIFAGYQSDLSAYFAFLENGGIPSAYTPLSQDVIARYIAALEGAGATQVFLGDLADFYQAYFAFVSGGGNPDNFAQLPVPPDFPAFAAALNSYAAFLGANGLPSDFTDTDLAALQEFFNAVQQSGQVNDLLGANADLLTAYFAFINGGGSADGFAGLPIYLDYVAALNAYFDFLAAGNLPSDYTVLDAATIEAYLAALAVLQGGLAGIGDLNGFFANYYDFLLAGNDPDLFDNLPGQGGGDPGQGGNPTLVYTGGFTPGGTGIFAAGSWSDEGRDPIDDAYTRDLRLLGPGIYDAILDENGGLERYVLARNNFVFADRGTAQTVDINGDEELLIGRWTNGTYQRADGRGELFGYTLTANQGFHYLLASGFSGPANYPTGRVQYDLLAATAPTLIDGSQAPGVFDANAAIIFGTSPAFAIDGSIAFADFTYSFATPGGVDGDGSGIFLPNDGNGNLGFFGVTTTGSRGSGFQGQITFQVQIPNAEASRFGVQYAASDFNLSDPSDQIAIVGAAIFGAASETGNDGGDGGGDGGPGNGNASGFTGTRTGQVYYTFLDGSLASGFGGSADFVDGEVTGFTSAIGTVSSNDAQIVEATDLEEIAWARWTNGTVQSAGLLGDVDSVIGPNGGYHVMTGEVTTNLPGGTIAYELIGGTSATDNVGSTPGTVTGDLAIAFGSVNRVGYDLTMALGGRSWSVSTSGGAADPGASEVNLVSGSAGFTFGGAFTNTAGTVNSTGDTCAPGCFVNVSGTLYGNNAAYAALAMNVTDTNSTGVVSASGLAIFGQEGAASSITDPVRNATAITQSQSPIAPTDWSRWGVEPLPGGAASTAEAVALSDLAVPGSTAAIDPAQKAAAIAEIEGIMGNTITWGEQSQLRQ